MRSNHASHLALLLLAVASAAWAEDATMKKPATKPCDAPECRQFDFWIGDWEVDTPAGQRAGTNHIESILDGCVLFENWSGARGGSGKSFNLYSSADHRWHQTWVDNQGTLLELTGEFRDGVMSMEGDTRGPKGTVRNRITWQKLEDGRLRQHWTTSSDGGATWTDAFVGLYRRKGSK